MEDQTIVVLWAITVVGILEALALVLGIDGAILASVISTIVGLVGYVAGRRHGKRVASLHPRKRVEVHTDSNTPGAQEHQP